MFDRTGSVWTERKVLRPLDGAADERFGDAVAVERPERALVGAPFDVNGDGSEAGAVYAYDVTPPAPVVPTFIGVGLSSWTDPDNWSTGMVPGPTDEAVVPAGTQAFVDAADSVTAGRVSVAGEVVVFGRLTILDSSTIDSTGVLSVENGGSTTLDGAPLGVEAGGQVAIRSSGQVELSNGASISGSGLVANSGTVVKTGAAVSGIGADIDVEPWNRQRAPSCGGPARASRRRPSTPRAASSSNPARSCSSRTI